MSILFEDGDILEYEVYADAEQSVYWRVGVVLGRHPGDFSPIYTIKDCETNEHHVRSKDFVRPVNIDIDAMISL